MADAKPVKTPLVEVSECFCKEFLADLSTYGSAIAFKCHVHGDVTIDRRILPQPLQPQWAGNDSGVWNNTPQIYPRNPQYYPRYPSPSPMFSGDFAIYKSENLPAWEKTVIEPGMTITSPLDDGKELDGK